MMTPDYQRAAIAATEMLIKHNINTAPVIPLPVFKRTPGCIVLSFTELSGRIGMDRNNLITMFDEENHDAVTSTHFEDGKIRYLVTYNQRVPLYLLQRALARELGHIVLGHDGVTRPQDVRMAEAVCFAHHLISPRPVLHLLQSSGMPLTMNVLSGTTGCSDECVDEMQTIPGAHVAPDLNAAVRDLFAPHLNEYIAFHRSSPKVDRSPVVDFGTFMDNYTE